MSSSKESLLAAYMAHPFLDLPNETFSYKQHEMSSIYDFLRRNRVLLRTMNYGLSQKPNLLNKRVFLKELVQKNELFAQAYNYASRLRQKIVEIAKTMEQIGVEIIFIKSLNDFPLDSHNFDILVKEQDLVRARECLKDLGFKELVRLQEPFKVFYRRVDCDTTISTISIHLHTRVAWEGVNFVDSDKLWDKHREIRIDDVTVGFPSSEHHLLITSAHAFFENQRLSLCDLMYMVEAIQSGNRIDWNYIVDWCITDHWFKAFYAFLQMADHAYTSLYEKRLVEQNVYMILAKKGSIARDGLSKKLIYQFEKTKGLPIKIPITNVALSFSHKVFRTQGKSLFEKIGKVSSSGWHYLKRRVPLSREFPTFLICFSGQDGTGKTTHAKCLQSELLKTIHMMNDEFAERDLKTKYVWSRGIGSTIDPLLSIIRVLLLGSKSPRMGEYVSKRETLLNMKSIRNIWAHVTLADEALQLLIKVRLPLFFQQNIISDRYIYDALVDAECDLTQNVSEALRNSVTNLLPKPDIVFIADAEPAEIMKRKKDLEFAKVKCKRKKYLTYLNDERFILLDTEKDLQQNRIEILSKVLEALTT